MTTPAPRRNPWPIAITVYFILFAAFLATFLVWAVRQREDLVSADYYDREVRYQQQLDAMNQAQPLAMEPVVTFDPVQQSIVITLPPAQAQGAVGSVHLYRPSDARLDRDVPLALDPEGVQRLDTKELRDGLWKVRLKWTANGRDYFLDRPVIITAG
jgi:hypothetical protein